MQSDQLSTAVVFALFFVMYFAGVLWLQRRLTRELIHLGWDQGAAKLFSLSGAIVIPAGLLLYAFLQWRRRDVQ